MLDSLFKPRAVAIVGASTKELSIGNVIIKNLQRFGYKGEIYTSTRARRRSAASRPTNPSRKSQGT